MEWLPTPVFLPRESHGYTYIHSLLSFNPPTPSHPSRWSQNTSWAPCVIQHLPNIYFSHGHVYMAMLLPQLVLPSLSPPFSINLLLTPLILIAVFCLAKELLSTSNLLVVVIHCSVTQLCLTLFETPWIAARQTSLSLTISQGWPKFMSIESVMPSNYLILCHPLLLLPWLFRSIRVFSNDQLISHWHQVARVLELPFQHQSFQRVLKID